MLTHYQLANIIGTTAQEDIILEHLIDSLSCFLLDDLHRTVNIVDVGTGAGLPGIPLAIARPELHVALLEVTEKKVRFLNFAIEALSLQNLQVLHARAEQVGNSLEYRGTFELAVARALAALPVVLEYCAPLVEIGGTVLAMKGRLSEDELANGTNASRELKLGVREVLGVRYRNPLQRKERQLVVIDKVEATPHRFPRRVGKAKKRPLGH
jgi:16S rRNA (guanine527-N7)-methyltransferase